MSINMYQILKTCCAPIPQRFIVATTVLSGLAIQYIHRIAINLAVTEINIKTPDNLTDENVCKYEELPSDKSYKHAEFHWTDVEQAIALGIFYLGYFITQVPGGIIADLYGPKRVLGYGVVLSAIFSILTPVSARISVYALCAVRFFMGMGQGPLFPACSTYVARWSPPEERNVMNAYTSAGVVVGSVLAYLVTGGLFEILSKWDYVFYIYGVVTLIWYICIWQTFAHDKPATHPFISEKEQTNLVEALHVEVAYHKIKIDYKAVLTSAPVWAMIVAGVGNDWAFYIIITMLPQYMSYVLNLEVSEHVLLNCLPYISMLIFQMIFAKLATILVTDGYMSKTLQCKVCLIISNEVPCLCYIAASYSGCTRSEVVFLFTIGMGFLGLVYSCIRVVNVDMAPNIAGFLMSLMNGAGSICGFFNPYIFSLFTLDHEHEVSAWRNAFIFSAVLVTITTIVFLLFGSSKLQPWNFPKETDSQDASPDVDESKKD